MAEYDLPVDNFVDDRTKDVKRRRALFHETLARRDGPAVLADMLVMLGFFEPIENQDDVSRHNHAIELLTWCKVIRTDKNSECCINVKSLTNALLAAAD